ncbi:MAG: hypothetical protein ACR2OC_07745 [Solirubrobacterales bacterium]
MSRRSLAVALVGAAFALAPAAAQAQDGEFCLGETEAENVTPLAGAPPLGFGINPAGEAGALGPAVVAVPGTKAQDLAALAQLRPADAPFTVRLNRFFWSLGQEGVRRFLTLAKRYTNNGYLVELQLRYHPRPDQEGKIKRWLHFVRKVVRRFGPNEGVTALQVTNEVNFYAIAPDASDSSYEGAREALVRGVRTADRATERLGYEHLAIGFNWAYRTDPNREQNFWSEIGERGGPKFVDALDWIGLDAYPGTVFPPVETGDGYRDGMVNALSVLRECYLPITGIPASVPIKVEENGYPTGPGRSNAEQVNAMEQMVRAVHDYRGTFNVSDYRWFDLRDHATDSANFQHHYGILEDDYTPKPAFETYRSLIAELSGP